MLPWLLEVLAHPSGKNARPDDEHRAENLADLIWTPRRGAGFDGCLLGVPLAIPCNARPWFIVRRDRLRTCRDLFAGTLMRAVCLASAPQAPQRDWEFEPV